MDKQQDSQEPEEMEKNPSTSASPCGDVGEQEGTNAHSSVQSPTKGAIRSRQPPTHQPDYPAA